MSKTKLSKVRYAHKDSLMEGRFGFIDDRTLRENVAIYVQYITFLVSLDEEYDVGILTYSIYKDIVVHTAHVVESLVNYKLQKLIADGDLEENGLAGYEEKLHQKKEIHKCNEDGSSYVAGKLLKKPNKIKDDTKFLLLNRAGKKAGLLTKGLFDDCEEIRNMRNKIHLSGLKRVDDKYSKSDISNLFKITEKIIDRVRDYEIH